jgi:hypothetical protein
MTVSEFTKAALTRRGALRSIVAAGAALLTGAGPGSAVAQAPGASGKLPHVSQSDPLAKSLGYTDDASKADKAKFSNYKPGETCSKCRFYMGSSGQKYGPCQIFVGKDVSATGWCTSFAAKT